MHHHFGVGLADKHIALAVQCVSQFFMVFNDAIVNQCNARDCLGDERARTMAEVRVSVVYRWRTVGCPARMGNACFALQSA